MKIKKKNEYCKFYYFLSHWNYMRQKTKLSKKTRKTQISHKIHTKGKKKQYVPDNDLCTRGY